ncbi:MAG: AP protein [Acidobacteria bacterium]|nr:MAG: AP protein [Acidobacteriota bacterium]
MKISALIKLLVVCCFLQVCVRAAETRRVVLVTADGLRWQELFSGFDKTIVEPKQLAAFIKKYDAPTPQERRAKLLPFFWKEIAPKGVVIGNRDKASEFRLKNPHRFSYPGYAEILAGQHVEAVKSNDPVRIPQETVLEYTARRLSLPPTGVAAFAAWDIIYFAAAKNERAVVANAGYRSLPAGLAGGALETWNRLQFDILTPWDSVRDDAVTFQLAYEYLNVYKPTLLFLSLGQPDDWSHDGRYDRALQSIQHLDRCLEKLWDTLQSLPDYRGKTTLIVTTDHGRGSKGKSWQDHGEKVKEAEYVWLAAIGPDTPALGELTSGTYYQSQTAATILRFLGLDPKDFNPEAGAPIEVLFK